MTKTKNLVEGMSEVPIRSRRAFIVDSGAADDLMSDCNFTKYERLHAQICEGQSFMTANGLATFAKRAKIRLASSGEAVNPLVADNNQEGAASTPNIISLGRRIMDENYDFIWRRGQMPVLITPGKTHPAASRTLCPVHMSGYSIRRLGTGRSR